MASMKCPACGGRCDFEYGKGYVCDHCGNLYNGSENPDSITDKLNYANAKRIEDYDFEGALRLCHEILEEKPDNQEANWCALLAEYQIIYLQNDEGKYVPTFLNPEVATPLNKSGYYAYLNGSYRQMADNIERMRALVVREARDIPDYDVFISYRQHIGRNTNAETEEAAWADEIYKLLSKQTGNDKLRVFFDKASLDSSNAGWEPHIYAALRSAKFLILMGSSIDNINSTWVKNEWKRFIAYRQMGKEKTIAVLAKNIDPMKLPDIALRSGQMIKADEKGWQEKLVKRANDACKENKDVPYLLNEADIFIQKRKFKKAKGNYLKVCSLEPRNSKAYWGLLKCKLKAMDDYDLIKSRKKFVKINEYNDAIRYAVGKEKEYYMEICNAQLTHNTNGYERTNYNIWRKKSRVQRFFKKVTIIAAVLAVCAFGIYSYIGISQPINYTVDNGQATLSGKSIYFNFVVSDLEVDTYKDYPVVKIGDGALKNSSIKSVKLSESVKEIGDYAFENCTSLKSVEMVNCTYIGVNAFNACTNLVEIKIGITDTTVIAENAFSNLGRNVTVCVPSIAEKATTKLKAAYPDISFTVYTQDKVEECIYFIAKLSTLSVGSETDIRKAESLYNALSTAEKEKVRNYGTLQNARASYNAVTAINAIGIVTLNSEDAITEAENLYAALTSEQMKAVSNYATLTTARAVYNTMEQIAEIGEVQINSEPKIVKAEELYLALSYEQRDLVTNYSLLTSARTRVDTLLADAVIAQINAIGSVISVNSETLIATAEAAYNSLTDAQKNRVSNYDTLTDARAVYNAIKAIDNIGAITVNSGSTITIAQSLYDGLTSAQKLKVLNYSDLPDASAVFPVVAQIGAIGNILAGSISAIENAEAAYAGLSAIQQTKVSNYSTLLNSRVAYNTVLLIDEIGTVTEESGSKIEAAQNSYNSLSSAQKKIVGNYSKLSDASMVHNTILAIKAIGDVSLGSSTLISTAETNYSGLSSAQKQLVSNYETLVTARSIYNVMTAVQAQGTVRLGKGSSYSYQTLSTSNMTTILNNATIRNEIDSITLTGLVNLSNQSYWTSAFKKLSLVRYDLTGGITLTSFSFTPSSLVYRLVGSTSKYNIALTASSGDELNLEFDNFNFTSSGIALDLTKISTASVAFMGLCSVKSGSGCTAISAKNIYLSLQSTAKVTISAGNGETNNAGGIGVSATQVTIHSTGSASNTSLTINGGNGGVGATGNKGGDGGNGISATTVSISAVCTVKINGGVGGNAGSCVNSYSSTASGATKARDGSAGFAGGIGGDALNAYSLSISSAVSLECSGGVGGIGSTGGNGEHSNCDGNPKAGNGGAGGSGGSGGNAIYLSGNFSVSSSSASIKLISGAGGNAGAGGNGGSGIDANRRDDGGDGGAGGAGGNSGYCIFASSSSVSCKIAISASNGGAGGTGGNGGYATADASVTPKCGAGGKGGNGGNSCIASGISEGYLNISYGKGGNGGTGGSAGSTSHSAWLNKAKAGRSGDGGKGGDIIMNGNVVKSGGAGGAGSTSRINTYTGAAGGAGGTGASN